MKTDVKNNIHEKHPKALDQSQLHDLMEYWKQNAQIYPDENVIFFTHVDKNNQIVLEILTEHPGNMIGRHGSLINALKYELKQEFNIYKIYFKDIQFFNYV